MINEKQARRYCGEDISKVENYEKAISDKTQTWHIHHRLGVQGQFVNSKKLLKRCGMYYKRPASELIFLTKSEHMRLHKSDEKHPLFGKHRSEETKKKMSQSLSGRTFSEETKEKISQANLGKKHSKESRKKMSQANLGNTNVRGTHWYNDGVKTIRAKSCPEGFVAGRI